MAKRRVVLNDVTDPHKGLRLLSERPKFSADQLADPEKWLLAEQRWRFRRHLFELQIAFEERGEVLALAHGLVACQMCREVPPRWLARAAAEYITKQLPKSPKRNAVRGNRVNLAQVFSLGHPKYNFLP